MIEKRLKTYRKIAYTQYQNWTHKQIVKRLDIFWLDNDWKTRPTYYKVHRPFPSTLSTETTTFFHTMTQQPWLYLVGWSALKQREDEGAQIYEMGRDIYLRGTFENVLKRIISPYYVASSYQRTNQRTNKQTSTNKGKTNKTAPTSNLFILVT